MKYLKNFESFNIDDILDKISASGMNSLTTKEKAILKNQSNDNKDVEGLYQRIEDLKADLAVYDKKHMSSDLQGQELKDALVNRSKITNELFDIQDTLEYTYGIEIKDDEDEEENDDNA